MVQLGTRSHTLISKAANERQLGSMRGKIEALIHNADVFPAPNPTVAELTAEYEDLLAKTVVAEDGSKDQKNARDIQISIVKDMLYRLMTYILSIAATAQTFKEQQAIIERANFVLAKPRQPAGTHTGQVQGVKISWTGNEGEVLLRFKRVKNIRTYQVQITTSDPASPTPNWQDHKLITRSKLVISDLQPLTRIWCRVIAHGPAGTSVPSDPAMSVVG